MDKKGYMIFCDESLKQGPHYSNFYGGVMVGKSIYQKIIQDLNDKISQLNIEDSELKWSKVNSSRVKAYCEIIGYFLELAIMDLLKIRIMFTDNRYVPLDIDPNRKKIGYHLLYYQFIKHNFGFPHLVSDYPIDLELFFDILPDKKEKNKKFKNYIYGLQFLPELGDANLKIKKESIYEVDSKNHLLLQCIDVVLGSMAFRLNDFHKLKPEGSWKRGKRTIAKEQVYKFINKKIREIRPHFNIGISTGTDEPLDRFIHAYRHWLFVPKNHNYQDSSKNKKRSKLP